MTSDALTAARIGRFACIAGIIEGVLYLLVIGLLVGMGALPPPEPWASLIAVLLLVTIATLLVVAVAACWLAPAGRRPWAVLALVCMIIFSVYVSIVRLLQLALLRPLWNETLPPELALLHPYALPSLGFTLEVSGWGFWLGLALLALAATFRGVRRPDWMAWIFTGSGLLALVAGLAPILGASWLTTFGILAWGPGLIAGLWLLAAEFRSFQQEHTIV
ncbi:MAG TPA: hypothetical protein PKA05_02375 [Roseiflexaceae bacterium]|nr:hypothetical protein [Roseiflexaceae bacterium]HMP39200.1 hypothetical protein [Roseiflexaceae bacterium]